MRETFELEDQMVTKRKKAAPAVPEVNTETTVEWQVTPGDTRTVHIFHTPGAVFGFLASEWQRFVLSWTPTRTCNLGIEIRRVEREKHSRQARDLPRRGADGGGIKRT